VASQEAHPRSLCLFLSCSDGNSPRRGSKLPGNVNGTDAKGTQKKRKEDKANAKRRRAGDRISAQINNSWMWMCYCTVDLVFTKFRTQSMTQSAAAPLGLSHSFSSPGMEKYIFLGPTKLFLIKYMVFVLFFIKCIMLMGNISL